MARIFFLRNDSQNHPDLWVTNGTVGGTHIVQDFVRDGVRIPAGFTNVDGNLFLAANDGVHGTELWKSDGATAALVQDIATGTDSNGNPQDSNPAELTNISGRLFFTASGEVWRSDGTDETTMIVKDIHPGAPGSSPEFLTNVNGVLYFNASASTGNGHYLWASNGTAAGTNPVSGAANSAGNLDPTNLVSFNGSLYFSATDGSGPSAHGRELWKSDGSGIALVKDISPGPDPGGGFGSSFPKALFAGVDIHNSPTLYFVANDGTHDDELWRSDGSDTATVMVKDIDGSGNGLSLNGNVVPFVQMNGILYFVANDGTHGFQLWRSDGEPDPSGTGTGTRMVAEIHSGAGIFTSGDIHDLTVVGDTLYFTATSQGHGAELWKSDGSQAGTVMVKEIAAGQVGSNPLHLANVGGTLFFSAFDGNSISLWRSDGTAATTVKIIDGFVDGGQIVATDESGLGFHAPVSDFNGDTFGDILFRNNSTGDTGYTDIHNGGFHSLGGSPVNYSIVGAGDYNGDNFNDLLFRDSSTGDTGYTDVHNGGFHSLGGSPVAYSVVGSGDYNGDRFSDLLFRNNSTGDTGYTDVHNGGFHSLGGSPTAYSIVGSGDYNGDHFSDLLFRNNSTGDTGYTDVHNGGFHSLGSSPVAYSIVGSGDYNGDGFSDLLFRNNSTGDTGYTDVHNGGFHSLGGSPVAYSIVASGDYNADGFSDLLFRNNSTGDAGYTDVHNGGFHSLGASPADYLVAA